MAEQAKSGCIGDALNKQAYNIGFLEGAKAVLDEVENLFEIDDWQTTHRIAIWKKIQELKSE